ncbi:MAG: hypothetical protein AAF581_20945 [Planctomycetota bacterium]
MNEENTHLAPTISPRDFDLYQEKFQRNEEYNDARLVVRRKLDSIGKHLLTQLKSKTCNFNSRASLHHPYTFNGYRVSSQFVYLSRGDKERKELKRILGVDLGKDLDQNFAHVLLVLEIYEHGLEVAIRIHKGAWWDGENLKRRLAVESERKAFSELLQALPEYGLRIDDHRKIHACETMTPQELAECFQYYTPGNDWLHISRDLDRDDPIIDSEDFLDWTTSEFKRLLPVYQYLCWSSKNNHLFG